MIYIVEDDQSIRNGFMMLLKSAGHECKSLVSAEMFLASYHPALNDLLILDMQLTGMNGCKLLETLAAGKLHLPVIIITSFDDPRYRQCSRDYGAIAYLRKPVDGEALLDIIQYRLVIQH